MKDWKAIAKGSGLSVPDEEMDRIVKPLYALEETFRPLVKEIPFDLEPAAGACGTEAAE